MPIDGEQLVIEPTYPYAGLAHIGAREEPKDGLPVRSIFWSSTRRCRVAILERADGKVVGQPIAGSGNAGTMLLSTLGASYAWGLEQEERAQELLHSLLLPHIFKQYWLTGTFIETSRRSGITYLFRRLRPTVALATRGDRVRVLATLCMHPIGYYAGSWSGAMCPTDDVIAHLMLMRADERMFWKRCNQHQADRPESGL